MKFKIINKPKNSNIHLSEWIDEVVKLCKPAKIQWCNGSQQEADNLFNKMEKSGSCIKLNPLKRPNSYLFRSDPRDVARVESKTFICSKLIHDAGPTNQWRDPVEMNNLFQKKLFNGCMEGRTMYIIPFIMGPISSSISQIGIQVTDSPYVVVNMRIMMRIGNKILNLLTKKKSFIPCLHSVGYPLKNGIKDVPWPCNPDNICIAHFPEERKIVSYGSGYGGNALLGKKCLGLRIASKIAKDEGWLAEHMLILGIESPNKEKIYISASFPSSCGKTNLAMVIPPKEIKGWKITTVGDDIAWIKPNEKGKMYAINPESGFFGVATGTSYSTNPNAMNICKKNTIFTNVALKEDNDVWWEGMTEELPNNLIDWRGEKWDPTSKLPAAHPNSRFTAPIENCSSLDEEWNNPNGVPISAFIYGGRRKNLPLIYQAYSWNHGVYFGATMGSEKTAAAEGKIGEFRNDPMAMLPFCGYNIGDYFNHYLGISKNLSEIPKIFYVNWFRKNDKDDYMWPGFSQNMRILQWISLRTREKIDAKKSVFGWMPKYKDIDWNGLFFSEEKWNQIQSYNADTLKDEFLKNQKFFLKLEKNIPQELLNEQDMFLSRF